MAWRFHGHARVSSRHPSAAGICDRCGRLFTLGTFSWQYDWAGERLINKKILVCRTGCLDIPQEQLRARILPPDPVPVLNARPEPFTFNGVSYDETQFITTEDEEAMISTEDGIPIITEGCATGD